MNTKEFQVHAKDLVDYICKYIETIEHRRVFPNVSPGYLAKKLPNEAPEESEGWHNVVEDVEKLIMPGITHWQHPRFHAFFPSGNSFPSIMGDMISDAIGCIGFTWAASPACTELEMVMVDWLAKMMNLPPTFIHSSNLGGGGVIQGSTSDAMLVTLIAARHSTIDIIIKSSTAKTMQKLIPGRTYDRSLELTVLSKMVCYASVLAHSSVSKNAMICFVEVRLLNVDENYAMRGKVLEEAIEKDIKDGYIPFFVCATLGTMACCSFDNLEEIGRVCQKFGVWLHVNAAYAGGSFICPEFRYLLQGIEYADSFDFNPNKFMLINFDCTILWLKHSDQMNHAVVVDPEYLKHEHQTETKDFRNWSVALSRRFRALKIWFTIRSYGQNGLQQYIRNHVQLAKQFGKLIRADNRFVIIGQILLGQVCFRFKPNQEKYSYSSKGLNFLNETLLQLINKSGLLYMSSYVLGGKIVLRFCVCHEHANLNDIFYSWRVIRTFAGALLDNNHSNEAHHRYNTSIYQSRNFVQSERVHSKHLDRFTRMEMSDPPKNIYNEMSINTVKVLNKNYKQAVNNIGEWKNNSNMKI